MLRSAIARPQQISFAVLFSIITTSGLTVATRDSHTSECGGVEVRIANFEFETAFAINYTLALTEDQGDFCIPVNDRGRDNAEDVNVLELRREFDSWEEIEKLSQPVAFQKLPDINLLRHISPNLQRVSIPQGESEHDVPAGRYRLVFRYRRAPCAGITTSRVCIAASKAFELTSRTRFAIIDHRLDSLMTPPDTEVSDEEGAEDP